MERTYETTQLAELLPPREGLSVNYDRVQDDEIEITDEELQEAIRRIKSRKAGIINEQRYWDKVNTPIVYPKKTAVELGKIIHSHAKSTIPGFVLDDEIKWIFKLLCQYFTQDPEFETDGYSLKKGLLLFGNVGCGKTTLMRLFQQNVSNDYALISCRTVADEYTKTKDGGAAALELYSGLIEVYPHEHYGQKHIGYCFDDLGTEKNKKYFGNELNVMEDIFLNRYDKQYMNKTHITTNLDPEQIEQVYGARVRSRLREMCNVICFDIDAKDRRV